LTALGAAILRSRDEAAVQLQASEREQENKLLRQQFEIAWRTLLFYKLEANPLRANDAVARILALGPVQPIETQGETTKP
jgi:hypothetical protein